MKKRNEPGKKTFSLSGALVITLSLIAAVWALAGMIFLAVTITKEPAALHGLAAQLMLLLVFFAVELPPGIFLFIALPIDLLIWKKFGKAWICAAAVGIIAVPLTWYLISTGCFNSNAAASVAVVAGAAIPNVVTVFTVRELDLMRIERKKQKKASLPSGRDTL